MSNTPRLSKKTFELLIQIKAEIEEMENRVLDLKKTPLSNLPVDQEIVDGAVEKLQELFQDLDEIVDKHFQS